MKFSNLILAAALGVGLTARAGIYFQGTVSGGGSQAGSLVNSTITDGNAGGMWNTMDLTGAGLGSSLLGITVTLNLSGSGYNGDFYAYLSYNGVLVPLLNRVGVGTVTGTSAYGFSSSGYNITLNSASPDIHLNNVISGTYGVDGRTVSPLSSASSFDTSGRVTLDGRFGGMNPNGQWTLFFADVVAGGGNSTLTGWSLDITAVPEPVNVALALFGALFAGVAAVRWRLHRKAGSA
jgi:hypothetical protein